MKTLPKSLVFNVKKIVRILFQGKFILPERYGKWIEGLMLGYSKKTLDFFWGGGI